MNGKRSSPFLAWIALSGLISQGLAAQPTPRPRPQPLAPETQVDTLPGDSSPGCPRLALAPDRSFEIAWDYRGFSPFDIYARHYTADGEPTDPAQVEIGPAGSALNIPLVDAVTAVSNGFRVLAGVVNPNDQSPVKFFQRGLGVSGVPLPGPHPVGGADTFWVWPGPGDTLYAGTYLAGQKRLVIQRVSPAGRPVGQQILLNSRPVDDPVPVLVPVGDDGFVAVWKGISVATRDAPARQVIRARRFRRNTPEGKDFDVNVAPGGAAGSPPFVRDFVVAADPHAAGFAVAWTVSAPTNEVISVRFFGFPGPSSSAERLVTSGSSVTPVAAAFDGSGELFLLWRNVLEPSFPHLFARLFRRNGAGAVPVGVPFEVQSEASGDFDEPSCGDVAWAGSSWWAAWEARKADGHGAVFVRPFTKGT